MAVAADGIIQNVGDEFDGMAHIGTRVCADCCVGVANINGANMDDDDELLLASCVCACACASQFTSTKSLFAGRLRFLFTVSLSLAAAEVVGIFRVPLTDMAMAGTVPVPVAAIIDCSACSSNQRMVSPSDLWPSSRVSWKIRAAQVAGIRMRRPRPSTFVWRSFVDALLGGGGSGTMLPEGKVCSTSSSCLSGAAVGGGRVDIVMVCSSSSWSLCIDAIF